MRRTIFPRGVVRDIIIAQNFQVSLIVSILYPVVSTVFHYKRRVTGSLQVTPTWLKFLKSSCNTSQVTICWVTYKKIIILFFIFRNFYMLRKRTKRRQFKNKMFSVLRNAIMIISLCHITRNIWERNIHLDRLWQIQAGTHLYEAKKHFSNLQNDLTFNYEQWYLFVTPIFHTNPYSDSKVVNKTKVRNKAHLRY